MFQAPDPLDPSTYPKRILLCVTGMSPAVVTETLHGLIHARRPFIPTEVHVITTSRGARLVQERLLNPDSGAFRRMTDEYLVLKETSFPIDNVHVIERAGQRLEDIQTPEDNKAAANSILNICQKLTRDADVAVHASIAGGRKSMGFLLGYAMSLVGREQDRVSHVLVSSPFDAIPDFFFPPATPRALTDPQGRVHQTTDAQIWLAEIPIVSLSDGLRNEVDAGLDFDTIVRRRRIEIGPIRVEVRPAARRLNVSGLTVSLTPTEMLWYTYFTLCRMKSGQPAGNTLDRGLTRIKAPKGPLIDQIDLDSWNLAVKRVSSLNVIPDIANLRGDYLSPQVTALHNTLRKQLGAGAARRVAVLGPRDLQQNSGLYGLMLAPDQLIVL